MKIKYILLEVLHYGIDKDAPLMSYVTLAFSQEPFADDINEQIIQLLVENNLIPESAYYSFNMRENDATKEEFEIAKQTRNEKGLIDGYFVKKGDTWIIEKYPEN